MISTRSRKGDRRELQLDVRYTQAIGRSQTDTHNATVRGKWIVLAILAVIGVTVAIAAYVLFFK